MAMSKIWIIMVSTGILFGIAGGRSAQVGAAALEGAQNGVTLGIGLAGALCLWSGLARVMDTSGLADKLARLLQPVLKRLFPRAYSDRQARQALCGNLTANLLGLGNAATPLGIAAVKRMKALNGSNTADNEMCRLVVLNTASLQLIPSTVAALRASLGAAKPFDILPAVWLSSAISVSAGLLAARLMERRQP